MNSKQSKLKLKIISLIKNLSFYSCLAITFWTCVILYFRPYIEKNKIHTQLFENYSNRLKPQSPRLPDVICIGAKKCGTGALQYFLNFHPDFRTFKNYNLTDNNEEELHFFDKIENYKKGIDWYLSLFPSHLKANQILFEKSPRYLPTTEAPKRIIESYADRRQTLPKLIILP